MIHIEIELDLKEEPITPYNHTVTRFSLEFPESYPIDPPKLKCLNRIYHPNISYSGSVCLPLVREDWQPTTSLDQIIYGLIFILSYPNADDALEPQIGDQMKADLKLFSKIVEYTSEGRSFQQKQYDRIRVERSKELMVKIGGQIDGKQAARQS